ncbi:AI-2E family transporter [Methylobacterium sp. sgz302541]|uniref:AI-2E family transporter n=1 Tax=unclassified Methylobacterium TaxID=2615210 RepID=UPI003D3570C6
MSDPQPDPVTIRPVADPWPFLRAGIGTVAFVAVLALAWISVSTLLLIFSGVLLGVFLDGLTRGIGRVLPLPRALRLTIASLAIAAGALGLFAYGGATVAQQGRELGETVRKQADTVTGWLSSHGIELPSLGGPAGNAAQAPEAEKPGEGGRKPGGLGGLASSVLKSPGSILSDAGNVLGPAATVILGIFGALGNVLVIGFLGLAFAADPGSYRRGILHFVPPARRERGDAVLEGIGETLRHWLFGQIATMTVIFLCIWGGLTALGVGGGLILGLQAGLLAFVPTVGPLAAGLVILLASLSQGLNAMLAAFGVYLVVQMLESYVLTPIIQKRALDIPPATIFAGQLLLGGLLGLWGIALALPLMAVLKVLLEQLYVEDTLGE